MDNGIWPPAWNLAATLALVLVGGAWAGWMLVRALHRWGERERERQAWASPIQTAAAPRPARSIRAAQTAGRDEDDWPDTVLAAPGHQPDANPAADDTPPTSDEAALPARYAQGVVLLAQRRYDSAWAALQDPPADPAVARALLKPLDRLAAAYEQAHRYEQARAVYERMADLDPAAAASLKPRLVRARGLAMATRTGALDLNASQPEQPVASGSGESGEPGWVEAAGGPLPARIGRFIIQSQIGRGAMGAVYLAHDPNRAELVALKTLALSREFAGPELADARARFFREAEMAGRLNHPSIVRIFDTGEADGLAYIAMEWVQGLDLSRHASPSTLLPLPLVLRVACRCAEALAYAHSRGVTHRDIKPANIMIDLDSDLVKVMDFGVARITDSTRTRTGVVLGTPSFMSPEQLAGQRVDGRCDLYALGVTLFQLLTGHLPFQHRSMAALMRAIANDPAPDVRSLRPDLPEPLANIVALALEKHPEVRYADGHQMAADLRAVGAGLRDPMDNRPRAPLPSPPADR